MSSETEINTLKESKEESAFASLGLQPTLFIWQLVNFLLVVLVLWYLILRPLSSKLEERRKIIDDSLERVREIEKKMRQAEEMYQARIKEAETAANQTLATGQANAKVLTERMKTEAKEEINRLVEQSKANIKAEKEATISELRQASASMALAIAEKILGEKLDNERDGRLVKEQLIKMSPK